MNRNTKAKDARFSQAVLAVEVLVLSLLCIPLFFVTSVNAGSISFFYESTSGISETSQSVATIPNNSRYPLEYYVNVGETSRGNVEYKIVAHKDIGGVSSGKQLVQGICGIGGEVRTTGLGGSTSPVIPTSNYASITLNGKGFIISTEKFIAGAVLYNSTDSIRSIDNTKNELVDYVKRTVKEMDAKNN